MYRQVKQSIKPQTKDSKCQCYSYIVWINDTVEGNIDSEWGQICVIQSLIVEDGIDTALSDDVSARIRLKTDISSEEPRSNIQEEKRKRK